MKDQSELKLNARSGFSPRRRCCFSIPRFSTVSEWLNVRLRAKLFFFLSRKRKIEMRGKRNKHSFRVLFKRLIDCFSGSSTDVTDDLLCLLMNVRFVDQVATVRILNHSTSLHCPTSTFPCSLFSRFPRFLFLHFYVIFRSFIAQKKATSQRSTASQCFHQCFILSRMRRRSSAMTFVIAIIEILRISSKTLKI